MITTDLHIISVSAADVNYDGKLDLIIQGKNISEEYFQDNDGNNVQMEIYLGDYNTLSK